MSWLVEENMEDDTYEYNNDDYFNYEEIEYYENTPLCERCGQPLSFCWETDEVFGRMDCYKVYYCPKCDK